MTPRDEYKSASNYMRKRLNAGCQLNSTPCNVGPAWHAAKTVILASGRQPAPVFRHELHYQSAYLPRR